MNQHSQRPIQERLRQSEIQEEIWRNIQEARENVKVTISKAASLFGLTESRLREWDKRGLLQTERSILPQEGKGQTGHRQYSSAELEKLAIISVLLAHNVSIGEIPPNVDQLWREVVGSGSIAPAQNTSFSLEPGARTEPANQHIDRRVEEIDRQEFWRYFVAQTLRLTLMLICEDIPDSLAGIILPLEGRSQAETIGSPEELPQVGFSLVGWQGRTRSFSAFLDSTPVFEYASDYRLERLVVPGKEAENWVQKHVIIVLQRRARALSLSSELVETASRMLELVYERVESWRYAFDGGGRDWLYQAHDLERASSVAGDLVFNSLLERIIELGGKSSAGHRDRWDFCCLLVPNDWKLPIQQQNLIVRAQTERSPYEIGMTTINQLQTDSLGQKAFLSGQIISLGEILPGQSMISYQLPDAMTRGAAGIIPIQEQALEKRTRSAIAVPVSGEYGISIAVLYVASKEPQAFSVEDQRVLRWVGRMAEELLQTSQVRRHVVGKMGNMIIRPEVVDPTFQAFASETDFGIEIEALLQGIQKTTRIANQGEGDEVYKNPERRLSIVSLDIDNQSRVALKYGNRIARNLSQQVGERILSERRFSDRYLFSKVFHVAADKYYWLLPDITLEKAQQMAWQLKDVLEENYKINPSYIVPGMSVGRPLLPESLLDLSEITVHLSVSCYTFSMLAELLLRQSDPELAPKLVFRLIVSGIEQQLDKGKKAGGSCISSWMPHLHKYDFLSRTLESTS